LGDCEGIALLSGGTDGEDGPTDAAGAFVTEDVVREVRRQRLDTNDFLACNDAYHFFERAGGLFITGPTQTNVCDLRVIVVDRAHS
jgi:glycerate-2-kinase